MAFYSILVLLSCLLTSAFYATAHSHTDSHSRRTDNTLSSRNDDKDIIRHAKELSKSFVKDLSNCIEKHDDDEKRLDQGIQPVLNNKAVHQTIKDVVDEKLKTALQNHVLNKIGDVRSLVSSVPDHDSVRKAIHDLVLNKIRALHSTESSSSAQKNAELQNHILNKISEIIRPVVSHLSAGDNSQSGVSSLGSANKEDKSTGSTDSNNPDYHETFDSLIQDISGNFKKLKSKIIEKVAIGRQQVKTHLAKEFDLLAEALKNFRLKYEAGGKNDNAGNKTADDNNLVSEFIREIIGIVKSRIDGIPEKNNRSRSDGWRRVVWENIQSKIKNHQFAKAVLADLHKTTSDLQAISKAHHEQFKNAWANRSDFLPLLTLDSKLRHMILEKIHYIREKFFLGKYINTTLSNLLQIVSNGTGNTATQEVATEVASSSHTDPPIGSESQAVGGVESGYSTINDKSKDHTLDSLDDRNNTRKTDSPNDTGSTGEIKGSDNIIKETDYSSKMELNKAKADSLEMASLPREGNSVDNDNPALVILLVVACVVGSAAIGVVGTVMWKKSRRNRLYTRIPSKQDSIENW